jgi:4-carboxymuconolactone decarboxylase
MRLTISTAVLFSMILAADVRAQERMTPIPKDKLSDAQKKAAAEFEAARGALTGPWAVMLRSPEMINRARGLSDYLRFKSSLPPRLSELVILITAREWAQQYEWNAHHPLAVKGGLDPAIAKAIAEGRRPDKMAEDEAILYDFCIELHHNHSVSDATYARAVARFGENGTIEMVGVVGYYTFQSMVLNTARTPVPPGAAELHAFPKQ